MLWSKTFIPTLKEAPQEAEAISHKLLLRAGLIRMLTSGVYTYLPLGLLVLEKIEQIIREEMDLAGAQELLLPCLQPMELWKKTGRDEQLQQTLIRFKDRRGRELCLGPTHEEVITQLVKDHVQSYKQLPLIFYQIQTKFRDEIRPRFGLVRACEFIMKDAYSFDRDAEGLKKNYAAMYEAYKNIFRRSGLDIVITEADPGIMGGNISHEFMVPAENGEDSIVLCKTCEFAISNPGPPLDSCPRCKQKGLATQQAVEVGHIFQLGTKYSKAQSALFLDETGRQQPIIMGCYGIGVSRMLAAIIEKHNDVQGIIWPKNVAPFTVLILPVQAHNEQVMATASRFYEELNASGISCLLDDRPETAGMKFKDADLIGIPLRITVGENNLRENKVEIKLRHNGEGLKVDCKAVVEKIRQLLRD
ncbi:MAG: proline--tRNA ligase [Candidatus Omnitrophota bacterium]